MVACMVLRPFVHARELADAARLHAGWGGKVYTAFACRIPVLRKTRVRVGILEFDWMSWFFGLVHGVLYTCGYEVLLRTEDQAYIMALCFPAIG